MRVLFVIFSFILLVGCKRQSLSAIEEQDKIEAFILNKLDLQYYPAFSDFMGLEIDFKEEKINMYNPNEDFRKKLEPFEIKVEQKDLIEIDNIVKTISCKELENPSLGYALDGMHLEASFHFADGSIFHISPGNEPKKVYNILKNEVLEIVLKYNTSIHNDKIIEKIKEYNEDIYQYIEEF